MKNPKKLTYAERKIVKSWGLNPDEYKRVKLTNGYMELIHVESGSMVTIEAKVKGR